MSAGSGQKLSPAYSLYLDLVRCVAALAVFLNHLSSYPFSAVTRATTTHPLLSLVGRYGDSAVIVFFVLSGYVIAYVVDTRERTGTAYAISRVSRLYSVVLPALVLTYAFDTLGQWLHPQFYEIRSVLWRPASAQGYLSSLSFVNEFQSLHLGGAVPGTNAPFWSLSFEATYYLLAGLVLFAPLRYALPVSLVLLGLAGRTIAALLPLWVLGFWVYSARAQLARQVRFPVLLLVASTAAILAVPQFPQLASMNNFGLYFPWGHGPYNRNLLLDYATAIAFAAQMVAAQHLLLEFSPPARLVRLGRWLGGTTFPMYAMHFPALCLFAAISPFARASWLNILFVSSAVVAVIAAMTPLCDGLKIALRAALTGRARSRQLQPTYSSRGRGWHSEGWLRLWRHISRPG